MPRRTKEDAERTRARILASALRLFAKKGYERTTFTDIASRLKLTKGAVYWHFESKEKLLVALVAEMQLKFQRKISELIPKRDLTFTSVAERLIAGAEKLVQDPKGAEFFLLLQTQVRWGADSMAKVREEFLSSNMDGPYHAFIKALKSDIAHGRVKGDVDPVALASVCMAIWSGLVRSKIEKFLQCDLATTLRGAYGAIWGNIRVGAEKASDDNSVYQAMQGVKQENGRQ